MTRLLATLLILLCATPSFASDDDLAQRIKDNTVYLTLGLMYVAYKDPYLK